MREDLTSESYKRVYSRIQASEELRQSVLMRKRSPRRRKLLKYPYAAAIAAAALLLGGGSVCAYVHPALIRSFLGEQTDRQMAEKLYTQVERSISCDGYFYTAEGNIYNDEIGVGYLSIRIQKEDGTVPSVAYGSGRVPSDAYSLVVDGNPVILGFHTGFQVRFANMESDGDGVYLYMKYILENTDEPLSFYVVSYDELMQQYPDAPQRVWDWSADDFETACAECGDVEIPHQITENRRYVSEDLTVIIGPMDFYAEWNPDRTQVNEITLIDGQGNRQEILTEGEPVDNRKWAGFQRNSQENGTVSLYYPLQDMVMPDDIRVEINGKLITF